MLLQRESVRAAAADVLGGLGQSEVDSGLAHL